MALVNVYWLRRVVFIEQAVNTVQQLPITRTFVGLSVDFALSSS